MTPQILTPHVLSALYTAQLEGKTSTLETLVETINVRRADLRKTATALHQQGLLDVRTMRLTMMGFALGAMYASQELKPLRQPKLTLIVAA